ncbi:probable glutamate receptor [Takifugu rubripes]|uniref:Glutamate receptor n=1 Tax=Takifugu rubripes TaxID=31033 RepID=A0A674PA03_TAKRU|nr:probable glutamate receptor [Takifugu rubripes]
MKTCVILVFWLVSAPSRTTDAKEISITTIEEEPYTMTRGSELEGFCIDLLSQLSQKIGFRYDLHLVKDGRYGAIDTSGKWTGMIGELVRGEADLAVAPLTVTAARERFVDTTTPFMQTGLSFILRNDVTSARSSVGVMSPFSRDTWIGIFIAFLLTAFCMFLVGRISPSEWAEPDTDDHSLTFSHSLWYLMGSLTLQGAGPHPKSPSGRLISTIWWLFTILLLACYFSSFSLMMYTSNKQMSIQSFEDLANQDVIDYGTVRSGATMMFFKYSNNPVHRKIYQHMEHKKSFVSTMEEGVRRTQEGNFAFIGEAVSLELAVARYCTLTRSQDVIGMRSYAIAAPLGSPLVKNLSIAILKLSESGELKYLHDKWWASSCLPTDRTQLSPSLQPHDLLGLFLFLVVGSSVGLLLALTELLSRARNQTKDGKKSCCSVWTSELRRRFGGDGTERSSDKSNT